MLFCCEKYLQIPWLIFVWMFYFHIGLWNSCFLLHEEQKEIGYAKDSPAWNHDFTLCWSYSLHVCVSLYLLLYYLTWSFEYLARLWGCSDPDWLWKIWLNLKDLLCFEAYENLQDFYFSKARLHLVMAIEVSCIFTYSAFNLGALLASSMWQSTCSFVPI